MLIKIISVPDGEAPLEIREDWVGLVLPVSSTSGFGPEGSFRTAGVISGNKAGNIKGFAVPSEAAIRALELVGKTETALWWKANRLLFTFDWPESFKNFDALIFKKEECQVLPRLELSEVQKHIELTKFEGQHPEVPMDLLLRANHVLDRWLRAHGCPDITHLNVGSEIIRPFWGLLSTYGIELSQEEKAEIVDSYNDD